MPACPDAPSAASRIPCAVLAVTVFLRGRGFPRELDTPYDNTGTHEAEAADVPQTLGQDVQQEPPDELHAGHVHRLPLIAVLVVLVAKQHLFPVDPHQPAVADRHAVGIA